MIIAAKQAPNTKDIATKLQNRAASRKAQSLDDLVDDAQFAPWLKYVDDINGKRLQKGKRDGGEELTTYNEKLTRACTLCSVLRRMSSRRKKLATDLQKGHWIIGWLKKSMFMT
ncbi:hypothetical protein GQ600_3741 [Phytophthora cactorum]|nr:hypothetical protein GQ600_3741 [Phytophthora cactorum]